MSHSLFVHAVPLRFSPLRVRRTFLAPRRRTHHASLSAPISKPPSSLLYGMRHSRALVRTALECAFQQCDARVGIDATCGRGSDTITLGRILGPSGVVHAVDIQASACEETATRYNKSNDSDLARLVTHCQSHENLQTLNLPPAAAMAVVYNLGWYPADGADRHVITQQSTTISSLDDASHLVAPGGIIVVTAYIGHPGGEEEADAVFEWTSKLPTNEWSCTYTQYPNRTSAPKIHICERIK